LHLARASGGRGTRSGRASGRCIFATASARVSSAASSVLPGCGASGYLSRFGRSVSPWTDRDGVSCGRTAFVPTACDGLKNELHLARRPGVLFFLFPSIIIRSLYGQRL
jgi:hypothetical protein